MAATLTCMRGWAPPPPSHACEHDCHRHPHTHASMGATATLTRMRAWAPPPPWWVLVRRAAGAAEAAQPPAARARVAQPAAPPRADRVADRHCDSPPRVAAQTATVSEVAEGPPQGGGLGGRAHSRR